ncbi:DUF1176 domain-containing protein [Candidatus Electronema sp. JC]|uniref:DUF1176 domain-containing protein n=1 Tax=Candidatus Electronema sp. JC TaxID=3401570 RepID=UPI003B428984
MDAATSCSVRIAAAFCIIAAAQNSAADDDMGIFSHKDWELACDNTRTCRAAGYQSEDNYEMPVSMLLTRTAGPNTPVSMELQLLANAEGGGGEPTELLLQVGSLIFPKFKIGKVAQDEADKLLAIMPDSDELLLSSGIQKWVLSLAGMKAVLLKMDEKQGRTGTPGALIGKGRKPEEAVLPPLPMKTLTVPHIPPTTKQDKKTLAALTTFLDANCDELIDKATCKESRSISRLSKNMLLVSQLAWRSAYNQGFSFWIINDKAPFNPQPVAEDSANDYSDGVIYAAQKRRGLGDCWYTASWVWTGKTFEKAEESSTDMCRNFFAGGAWDLPTFVNKVVNKNEPPK